jgi:hypothetical protein
MLLPVNPIPALRKGRSTAASFKKKKQFYIKHTEASTTTHNAHDKTLRHCHKLREEPKEAHKNCAVVAYDEPHQKTRPAASMSSKSNSSAMDPSPSSHTHVRQPSWPSEASAQNSPSKRR